MSSLSGLSYTNRKHQTFTVEDAVETIKKNWVPKTFKNQFPENIVKLHLQQELLPRDDDPSYNAFEAKVIEAMEAQNLIHRVDQAAAPLATRKRGSTGGSTISSSEGDLSTTLDLAHFKVTINAVKGEIELKMKSGKPLILQLSSNEKATEGFLKYLIEKQTEKIEEKMNKAKATNLRPESYLPHQAQRLIQAIIPMWNKYVTDEEINDSSLTIGYESKTHNYKISIERSVQ